jgi:hypothetical protein
MPRLDIASVRPENRAMPGFALAFLFILQGIPLPPHDAPTPSTTSAQAAPQDDRTPNDVRVKQFPPLNVTKDFFDRAYWVFGLLLVLVGIAQVYLVKRTLNVMDAQAKSLERQTKATETAANESVASAEAAKSNAAAAEKSVQMFMNKERARLRVSVNPLELKPIVPFTEEKFRVVTVRFNIHHFGATAADIIETGASASVTPFTEANLYSTETSMFQVPPVILPSMQPVESFTLMPARMGDEEVRAINEGKSFVHLHGHLKYKDVFDTEHETKFRYVWKSQSYPVIGYSGGWVLNGDPADNVET